MNSFYGYYVHLVFLLYFTLRQCVFLPCVAEIGDFLVMFRLSYLHFKKFSPSLAINEQSRVLHSHRINLSPFTKDFRV